MSIPTQPRNWSSDGASFEGAVAIEPTRQSKRMRLLRALRVTPLSTSEITDIAGTEGTRRLRELRQLGYIIRSSRIPGSTQRMYVLVAEPE